MNSGFSYYLTTNSNRKFATEKKDPWQKKNKKSKSKKKDK